ncbi:hypothetical protein lacNasYZ03_02600 [Lactobacillus nasalidis]|uniref:Uncharacterized protein n=1 Tax=Lactobacillus nasalidis TaxID=2797258 RepID=A0ABQ3W2N4_9LACO|nr:hypothetical protein [Lactobacillus nasalidis]GHV97401.1 hypothetical protein lacNasYZ01_05830 [Lactobacillus nasalidis]GHV99796.1 hypothetical protein lacNasYZ02_12260 [Lactobacillus nasalidis]GHW00573.1 hypothetical protein lacNasYZ03_02600 [Lactobacillus nasalidis]
MDKKLKAVSTVSVALALLGVAAPTMTATSSTVLAAKKKNVKTSDKKARANIKTFCNAVYVYDTKKMTSKKIKQRASKLYKIASRSAVQDWVVDRTMSILSESSRSRSRIVAAYNNYGSSRNKTVDIYPLSKNYYNVTIIYKEITYKHGRKSKESHYCNVLRVSTDSKGKIKQVKGLSTSIME